MSLDFPASERRLNAYLAEFHPVPPEKVSLHQHGSGEFIHVLSGTLIVHIGDDQQTLGAALDLFRSGGARLSPPRREPAWRWS